MIWFRNSMNEKRHSEMQHYRESEATQDMQIYKKNVSLKRIIQKILCIQMVRCLRKVTVNRLHETKELSFYNKGYSRIH